MATQPDASPPGLLVVDDDASLRRAVAAFLSDSGFRVREAACSAEALELAAVELPALIVLDVMMPGTDGLALLRQLRAGDEADTAGRAFPPSRAGGRGSEPSTSTSDDELPALSAETAAALAFTPVVLLTARGFPSDRIRGYEAGCSAYITKPFDPDELVAVIRALLQADSRSAQRTERQARQIAGKMLAVERARVPGAGRVPGARTGAALPAAKQPLQLVAAQGGDGEAGAIASASLGAVTQQPQPGEQGEQPAQLLPGQLGPQGEQAPAPASAGVKFTEREGEVLNLVSQGLMNKEIARELFISPRMVEKYVSRLLAKSGTSTRTELARFAVANGLAD
jgi:DNA-binding NarL/FixJ family response regulator